MPDARVITVADVCGPDGVYTQLVDKYIQCNPAIDIVVLQGRATADRMSALCNGADGPYLGDGTIALPDAGQLQACLDYLSSTACGDYSLVIDGTPCDVFFGQVPDSGMCENTEQCGAASYCDTSGGNACGACTARLADGMTCNADEQCANGACIGTQCGHLGLDNDPCFANNDCLGQRTCDANNNVCVAPPTWQVNDACQPNSNDCDPFNTGLYCKGNQCAPFLAIDAACRTGGVVQGICDVRAYDYCPAGNDAVCTPPSLVTQEGQPCGMLVGEKCDTGLVCPSPINGDNCVAYQQQGDTCGGGNPTDQCDLFMGCIDTGTGTTTCQYGNYSGACPTP